MKLFGFAYIHEWPTLCFGSKAWCFKLIWAKKYHWFRWYSFMTTSKSVWWQRVNSYPFKFYEIMILPNEEIYDLED